MVIVFSFIIHIENRYFRGTEIRGPDPPRKNWYPTKIKPSTVIVDFSIKSSCTGLEAIINQKSHMFENC